MRYLHNLILYAGDSLDFQVLVWLPIEIWMDMHIYISIILDNNFHTYVDVSNLDVLVIYQGWITFFC